MPDGKLPSSADLRPGRYFRLRLAGEEHAYPDLLDVSAFLLDLTTLYEIIRLGIENPDYEFTRFTMYRNRNRLPREEKLFLEALRHESPLDLSALFVTVGSGAATAWALLQVFEKIWNLPLNRRKLLAEVEKAEHENAKAKTEDQARRLLRSLEIRGDSRVLPRLEDRLRSSPVKVSKADVETVELPSPADDPKA